MHCFIRIIAGLLALLWIGSAQAQSSASASSANASLTRIKIATVGAPDLNKLKDWYTTWLGFKVREEGKVPAALAQSWGAPKSAGKAYIMMSSDGSPDVFIRAVQVDPVPGYKAQTTLGWNAFEIIVDDIAKLDATLSKSPFNIIGHPHALGSSGSFASISAMQAIGPAEEMLYFTTETGDRTKSTLPIPKAQVDRTFIVILAGHDVEAMKKFYGEVFGMPSIPNFESALTRTTESLGLPPGKFQMSLVRAKERGSSIELDGYPPQAKARPHADGQLPPGNALASFSVDSLDGLKVKYITAPRALYGKNRAASFIGPAGETVELIEDPRP
jgi:catechol 2,3-dioxygenase-like lactoylglutathione lyase family enzyme